MCNVNYETAEIIARRDAVFDALLKLLKTHALEDINVTQLCDAANVSRMFYYRHYQSYEDIVTDKLARLFDTYQRYLNKYRIEKSQELAELFFDFFKDYQQQLLILISSDLQYPVYYEFKKYLKVLIGKGVIKSPILDQKGYWSSYSAAGLTELLFDWVVNGCQESPVEMAQLIYKIGHNSNA